MSKIISQVGIGIAMAEDDDHDDRDDERRFWNICCECDEGFYSHLPMTVDQLFDGAHYVLCYRCWKEV